MEPADRIIRIVYADGTGLLASDATGRIHLLDTRLRVVRSSPSVRQGRPLYGLAVAADEGWVIGKDRMGAVFRWSLDTLELVDRLDPATVCDPAMLIPNEHPSPVSSRGIGIWDGRVYVTSGYHHQMLVLDLHTFEVLEIRPNICGASPMEWACTEHPTLHAVSDKKGNLRFGSFTDCEFPDLVKLDDGNIHRVRYDARHDRFWATQDFGAGENADIANGIVIVGADGEKQDECLFARDDVEFVTFSPDHLRAYTGGFDGELHIFDNTDRALRITRTVTGFPHQLSDLTIGADAEVYVLCQDGEIVQLDADGGFVRAMGFRRQAVWDIQPSPEDPTTLYCATDTGVAVVQVRDSAAGPMLCVEAEHTTGFGFTRRVAPVRSGWLGITRDHRAFRAERDGTVRWSRELPALPHTVAVSEDGRRALVATNAGAIELDASDGRPLDEFGVDGLPIWAATYLPDGDRLLITRNGVIVVLDRADATVRWRFDQGEYPKRLWIQSGRAYLTGDGGVKELVIGQGVVARWSKLLSNTIENAVVSDGLVCASSYGMQLAGYDYTTGKFLGLVEDLPDYPKALSMVHGADGTPYLLVGCRTGMLSLLRLERTPKKLRFAKLRDHWLSRHPAEFTLTHHDHPHTVDQDHDRDHGHTVDPDHNYSADHDHDHDHV
ncbi:WD40 repeat domain-containing protein [Streptomyces sp. NBC_01429]|uniref:WD40 repeat domain-containing protein n=1 Tax=Streptomyces sp. NBC_01429 TaxID=2903862 RepID=UPI002E2AF83A|nr:PQQ-binding-like beta-propeller repeat protein [Streptomyces sp. NBC_01429]